MYELSSPQASKLPRNQLRKLLQPQVWDRPSGFSDLDGHCVYTPEPTGITSGHRAMCIGNCAQALAACTPTVGPRVYTLWTT